MTKNAKRQTILFVVMGFIALLVVRQYMPMLQLPTEGRLQSKLRELKSVRGDLNVARKQYAEQMEAVQQTRKLAEPFWIAANGAKLDQEVNAEFSRLTRMAQLSATQKVDIARDRSNSNLVEVNVSLEFKGVSMRELTGFFKQLRSSGHAKQLRWEYARIAPDNQRSPRNVNCTLRFKIYSLNEDALAFLETGKVDGLKENANSGRNDNGNGRKSGSNAGRNTMSRSKK